MAASVPCPSQNGQTRRKCPRSMSGPPPTCTWQMIQGLEISECPRSECLPPLDECRVRVWGCGEPGKKGSRGLQMIRSVQSGPRRDFRVVLLCGVINQ